MLTPEDIQAFQAPLPLADHEAREKGTNKDKTKKQYLVYINQEGVIPLLNSIDPNWTWDVQNVHFETAYVTVAGRLTIKGVSRDGVGGNSPNGSSSPVDEDTVKGAETDALKRAALRFGVGLYLRGTPTFWVDAALPPWEGAKTALSQFSEWYRKTFALPPAKSSPLPAEPARSTSEKSASVSGVGIPQTKHVETKQEQGIMRQRPDETETDPNLYIIEKLIINPSDTALQYVLAVHKSQTRILLADPGVLEHISVDGMSALGLEPKTYKLFPMWSVQADHTAQGWDVQRIDAGVPQPEVTA